MFIPFRGVSLATPVILISVLTVRFCPRLEMSGFSQINECVWRSHALSCCQGKFPTDEIVFVQTQSREFRPVRSRSQNFEFRAASAQWGTASPANSHHRQRLPTEKFQFWCSWDGNATPRVQLRQPVQEIQKTQEFAAGKNLCG